MMFAHYAVVCKDKFVYKSHLNINIWMNWQKTNYTINYRTETKKKETKIRQHVTLILLLFCPMFLHWYSPIFLRWYYYFHQFFCIAIIVIILFIFPNFFALSLIIIFPNFLHWYYYFPQFFALIFLEVIILWWKFLANIGMKIINC